MSVNKVILMGNVGKDPEIKTLANDMGKLATFSIATSKSWKNKQTGEKQTETQWHNIVVFNEGLVSLIERFIVKGTKIYLEGELKTRKWTDNAGVDKYVTEIILPKFGGTIDLVSGTKNSQNEDSNHVMPSSQGVEVDDPFYNY